MSEFVEKHTGKDRKDKAQRGYGWSKALGNIAQEYNDRQDPKGPMDIDLGSIDFSQVERLKHAWIDYSLKR